MEFWVTRNDKKMLLVLTCLDNQNHLLQLYLHFPFNVSIDSFLSNAGCFFLKDMKIAIYNWLSVLTDQIWQKFFLVLTYLDIPTRTSWMKHIWIRLSRCVKLQWHLFECFLNGTNFHCVRLIAMLISRTCKNVELMWLVCRFSNWLISKAVALKSFDKVSI